MTAATSTLHSSNRCGVLAPHLPDHLPRQPRHAIANLSPGAEDGRSDPERIDHQTGQTAAGEQGHRDLPLGGCGCLSVFPGWDSGQAIYRTDELVKLLLLQEISGVWARLNRSSTPNYQLLILNRTGN